MSESVRPPIPIESRISAHDLRNIGLFGALPERVLDELATELQVLELPAGSYVFREGEAGSCMYVVIQGDVEVLKKSRGGVDSRVAVLGPSDWFGEMSIIDVQPRSATVLTVSPSRLVKVTAADLDRLYRADVKAYALIVQNIARELSRRLRVADGILAELIANVTETYVRRRT
jgi:CRP/FNR family transcriptional regulator, cyclic AMP receptor protein